MPNSEQAFVRFADVQKSYDGETLVVKNLNLDIARGGSLTMSVRRAPARPTCLMMLAGFETANNGEIYLDWPRDHKTWPSHQARSRHGLPELCPFPAL
jgi:putative spermidine/putrescine transport system ATP-binding protein